MASFSYLGPNLAGEFLSHVQLFYGKKFVFSVSLILFSRCTRLYAGSAVHARKFEVDDRQMREKGQGLSTVSEPEVKREELAYSGCPKSHICKLIQWIDPAIRRIKLLNDFPLRCIINEILIINDYDDSTCFAVRARDREVSCLVKHRG